MPRSVRVAIATSWALGLLGILSFAVWAVDLFGDDVATRWLSAAGRGGGSLRFLFSPLFGVALLVPGMVRRRDAPGGALAYQLALLVSVLLGLPALLASGVAALTRHLDAGVAGVLGAFGLAVVLAWSLSRPSAREWFTATPEAPRS
ncbi:MAG TPA: hypothetical protein VIV57_01315 [Anaeromyxobacter sp.]